LVELVPKGIGAPPPEPILPTGPRKETTGEKGQSSSYENRDTLKNQPDEDVFDYHAASQPAIVDATTAAIMPVGKAGIYESLSPAPDGRHVLVQIVHKPYSYATTYDRFPKEVEAGTGRSLPRRHAYQPRRFRWPIAFLSTAFQRAARFSWRATDPATLVWAEALDSGDWNVSVPLRDKIMLLKAPFSASAIEIASIEQRQLPSGSEAAFRAEIANDSNSQMAIAEMGEVRYHQQPWSEAAEQLAKSKTTTPELLYMLSDSYFRLEKVAGADLAAEAAAAYGRKKPELIKQLNELLIRNG
jgi:hypothetical protein